MAETLKPCPFCDGEAKEFTGEDAAPHRWTVECESCGTHVGSDTRRKARAKWNRRAERTCRNELSGYTDCMGRPVPDQFRCSECGEHSQTMVDVGFGDMASEAPKFCPRCGARVVGCDDA